MSGADPGEPEKKAKPALVRLGQNGDRRKSLGTLGGSPSVPRSTAGLQSFKSQRDLTLGVKPSVKPLLRPLERKKFVPNLNVQRLVKKDVDEKVDKVTKRKKENKHERREKNSKDRPNLIQTASIFSEGVGGEAVIRRRGVGGGYASRDDPAESGLVKPKINLNQTCDREAEELKLKSIFRDDFIDDLKEGSFVPVQLPMIDTGKMFKTEKKIDPVEDEIKPKVLNKKRSELDSDDDEDPAEILAKSVITESKCKSSDILQPEPGVAQLLKTQSGQLMFIQLPDSVPLLPTSQGDEEAEAGHCIDLSNLEGRLGKIQIRKSGRCQLVMGAERFDVEIGTKVGFLQDAVSVRVPANPEAEGELTVLGHVTDRLVLSPDWNCLLRESGLNEDLA